MKVILLLVLALLSSCSSSAFYTLPALPFSIEVPRGYGFLESDTTYIFSPQVGPATLVFEKSPTDLAFFQLFEGGYEELTPKSNGVWVICEEGDLANCFVQNMDFMELYPLHIQSDAPLTEEEKMEVVGVLNTLRKD